LAFFFSNNQQKGTEGVIKLMHKNSIENNNNKLPYTKNFLYTNLELKN
jgi:hypothetical protein